MALPPQLQTALAERGGALPALGFVPGRPQRGIPRGGGGVGFAAGPAAGGAAAGTFTSAIATGALLGGEAGLLGGPAGAAVGAVVGSVVGLLAGFLSGGIFSGRPTAQATAEIGARLAANSNPILANLGRGIESLASRGFVLSSRSDIQREFAPLVGAAVRQLEANGYPVSTAHQLVRNAVYNPSRPIAAAPVLPARPVVGGRMVAPLPSAGAQGVRPAIAPPIAPRPGYRVIRPPPEFTTLSSAQAAAAPSPYAPSGVAEAGLIGVPRTILERYPWLRRAIALFGIERAGVAVEKLLRGESLNNQEFGALAGTIIGGIAGDPLLGAQVGVEAGVAVDTLNEIAHQYLGRPLDQLLTRQGQEELQTLRRPQPQPSIPLSQQCPPGSHQCVTDTECERYGRCAPDGNPVQMVYQRGGQLQPQQPQLYRPRPQPEECPDCPKVAKQGDCSEPDSPIGQLAKQLVNCPTFQRELSDKLHIRQRPGEKPTLEIARPICLCCDSVDDLEQYVSSGGVRGKCVQHDGQADFVGVKQ